MNVCVRSTTVRLQCVVGVCATLVSVLRLCLQHVITSYSASRPLHIFACLAVYDPEGALGFISAAWMTFFGLQAGRVFTHFRRLLAAQSSAATGGRPPLRSHAVASHVMRWVGWGLILGLIGGSLCGFKQDGGYIPINKNLWSPSFVMCMASIAFLALALFFVLVDVIASWSGAPFVYAGRNSIIVRLPGKLCMGRIACLAQIACGGFPASVSSCCAIDVLVNSCRSPRRSIRAPNSSTVCSHSRSPRLLTGRRRTPRHSFPN